MSRRRVAPVQQENKFAVNRFSYERRGRRFAAGAAGGAVFVVRFVVVGAFVFVVVALRAGVASTSVAST
ncbi:hypothetical protein, partial [Burkholderia cenocepacia]|uniref:hypothetical protein n=2 Tax=Burkholderia cenocepacia TaxID=95486 RepID=UPI00255826B0